jgi:DME family drug/metabolite transporter
VGQGRPGRRWAAATALAVAGLAVLVLAAGGEARVSAAGVLLAVGAATSYAVYTVAVKDALVRGAGAEETMAAIFSGGALLLLPALFVLPVGWLVTPRGAAAALWLGLVPTTLAYVLFARGLRGLSAAETSTLTLAEPLTATALGIVALGESLHGAALAGAGLLLLGLVVLSVPLPRRATVAAVAR